MLLWFLSAPQAEIIFKQNALSNQIACKNFELNNLK